MAPTEPAIDAPGRRGVTMKLTEAASRNHDPTQARTYAEIERLVAICSDGRLRDVEQWIAAGKPVNLPARMRQVGPNRQSPLAVAIDRGIHSLVEVLLQAGARAWQGEWPDPMHRALDLRRLDLVRLLAKHGFDPAAVSLDDVFDARDVAIARCFIRRGADVERGAPFARALCRRNRTALRVFKRYRGQLPALRAQADTALRYHCCRGTMKWVAVLLALGADPWARGPAEHTADPTRNGDCALALAARHGNLDVLSLPGVRLDLTHPEIGSVVSAAATCGRVGLLEALFKAGLPANDQANGGSSLLTTVLHQMDLDRCPPSRNQLLGPACFYQLRLPRRVVVGLKMIETLCGKHGARWVPINDGEMSRTRRAFLRLIPPCAVKFASILARYRSCSPGCLRDLFRTPAIRRHMAPHAEELARLARLVGKRPGCHSRPCRPRGTHR